MVAEVAPDAAVLCIPPSANLSVVRQCLAKDMDIFVEKPWPHAGRRQGDGRPGRARPIVTAPGISSPTCLFKRAKALLADGVLGRNPPRPLRGLHERGLRQEERLGYDPEKAGGGVVITIASHLLVLYWYSAPESVYAQTKYIYSDVEDAGPLSSPTRRMQATMDVHGACPLPPPYTEIIVEAENGI